MSRESLLGVPPQMHKADSSFVANMPEVLVMRRNMNTQSDATFAYELVQNAIDYHKFNPEDPSDLPSIICIKADGAKINLADLRTEDRVRRIEVHNKIRGSAGLDPYDVVNIEHRAEGHTLGKHGRGGTVAATAALVDRHVTSIDYISKTPMYAWRGRGIMGISDPAHQNSPRFMINFEHIPNQVEETVIGINYPDAIVMNEFMSLPQMFLPTNSRYEGCKMMGGSAEKIPNLFTIFPKGDNNAGFSREELSGMVYNANLDSVPEGARIEILDDRLIGRDSEDGLTSCAFEGGLKLKLYSGKTLLNWSFYGLEKLKPDFYVSRSRDSSYIDGNPQGLINFALRHCESPDIFAKILKNCTNTSDDDISAEAKISASKFNYNLPSRTADAIRKAWDIVSRDLQLGDDILVTTDPDIKSRIELEGAKAVLIKSEAFATAVKNIVGLRDAKDALGIFEKPARTGEYMGFRRGEKGEHLEAALSRCIEVMSINNGVLNKTDKGLTIELSSAFYRNFTGNYGELSSELRSLIENYLLSGGSCELRVGGYLFEFDVAGNKEPGHKVVISIKKGSLERSGGDKAIFQINIKNEDDRRRVYDFYETFTNKVNKFTNKDGIINWEQYFASQTPPDVRSLAKIIRAQREELDARKKAEASKSKPQGRELPSSTRLSDKARSFLTKRNAVRAALALTATTIISGSAVIGVAKLGNIEQHSPSAISSSETHNTIGASQYKDTLPDKISSSSLENVALHRVGNVINLPKKWFNNVNGEAIGYFPADQFLNFNGKSIVLDSRMTSETSSDTKVRILNYENMSISDVAKNVRMQEDDLVYSFDMASQVLYAPLGWRIKSVYQQGGADPEKLLLLNSNLGVFWPDIKDVPKKVIVVAEKIDQQRLDTRVSPRIVSYGKKSSFGEYEPSFNLKEAMYLNSRLEGDSKLQSMHRGFITEMYSWTISKEKDRKQATDIVLEYLNKLSRYSDERNYSLSFQIDKEGTGYDALISIANNPDKGYFCSVASNVVGEFLKSAGIVATNQPGNAFYNIGGVMYQDISHQNNVVYAPDGTMFTVDDTPFITDRTDQTTINAFTNRRPSGSLSPNASEVEITNLLRKNVNIDIAGGDIDIVDKVKVAEVLRDSNIKDINELQSLLIKVGIGADLLAANSALLYFAIKLLRRRKI